MILSRLPCGKTGRISTFKQDKAKLYQNVPECLALQSVDEWHPSHSPPSMGGDKGEGEIIGLFTPTSILPHQGGGACLGKIQMPRRKPWGDSLSGRGVVDLPHILICEAPFAFIRMHGVLFKLAAIVRLTQDLIIIFMLDQEVHYLARSSPYEGKPRIS